MTVPYTIISRKSLSTTEALVFAFISMGTRFSVTSDEKPPEIILGNSDATTHESAMLEVPNICANTSSLMYPDSRPTMAASHKEMSKVLRWDEILGLTRQMSNDFGGRPGYNRKTGDIFCNHGSCAYDTVFANFYILKDPNAGSEPCAITDDDPSNR